MRLPQDYDSELLIEAITAIDWSKNPSTGATKIIQATVQERFHESLSSADAIWIVGSLLNRRLIRMQIHPQDDSKRGAGGKLRRRVKYVRVPPDER